MVSHEGVGEATVGLGALRVALAVVRRAIERGHRGARAGGDGRGEAGVVEVMMRQQDELHVLDPRAGAAQPRLERREGVVGVRAGVHQGQRVAAQQPGVDRSDVRQRDWDLDDVFHAVVRRMPAAPGRRMS